MRRTNGLFLEARGRVRRSTKEIARLIGDYQRSGLSQGEFCRQENVPLSSFTHWLRQGRRNRAARPRQGRPAFRQVDLGAMLAQRSWAAEVVRPDGLIVRVGTQVCPHWLGQILGAC